MMQISDSLQIQEEENTQFKVQNEIYLIKVRYSLGNHHLEFDVEEKRPFEFYHAALTNETFPEHLSLYQTVQTLYCYLSRNPEKNLEYNTLGKYILFFDWVGKNIKYFKIYLERRVVTEQEKTEIKYTKISKEKQGLEGEVNKLKIELQKVKQKEVRLTNEVNQLEKEKSELLFRIKKQEEEVRFMRAQNNKLKNKFGVSERAEEQDQRVLQNLRKLRKGQGGAVIVSKICQEKEEKVENIQQQPRVNFSSSRRGRISKESQFDYNSTDLVYYGTKMKYYIQEQPNYKDFKIEKTKIIKIAGSQRSGLLFLTSQDKMYLQQKKQSRLFLEVKNTTGVQLCEDQGLELGIGILPAKDVRAKSVEGSKAAIFLTTGKSLINILGVEIDTKFPIVFNQSDVIRLVLDLQIHLMAWFLNDNLIREVVIDSNLMQEGFHPFIELKLQGSSVQLL